MTEQAIEKITNDDRGREEKYVPAEPIVRFLVNKCSEDAEFCKLVMQEQKTLAKCFTFVYEQVKNHLNREGGWIEDCEVYLMAVDYFNLDDAEAERVKAEEEAFRQSERNKRANEAYVKRAIATKTAVSTQMSLFDFE